MAEVSYSVANLSSETREFTLRVATMMIPKGYEPLVDQKLIPPGGFVHRMPQESVGPSRFIRALVKDNTSEKKLHKHANGVIARIELRYTAQGELVVLARGADWKELVLTDAPDTPLLPIVGDG